MTNSKGLIPKVVITESRNIWKENCYLESGQKENW